MKKVSLLLCLLFTAYTASAQESGVSAQAGRKTTFANNGFGDNWFVGAGAGAAVYVGPTDQHAMFTDRMTINPTVFIGKWFNPYLGARLAAQGGKIHSFNGSNAEVMNSMTHMNIHADMMFNVSNYFGNYDSKRFYNFIPTVGFGYQHRSNRMKNFFKKDYAMNGFTINGSLLNTFRLSDKLSAFVEVGGAFVESRFDLGKTPDKGMHWNGIATGSAGLVLNFGGKTDFTEAVLMDQGLVDDLNGQINNLRNQVAQLSKRPEKCVECPKVEAVKAPVVTPVATSVSVPNAVFFRLNSANIDSNQQLNIFNTAEYLKNNSNASVKIIGYADKQTGTADHNMKLSERRAKNVAKTLIEKYNIDSNRVKVEWKGSSEQPYKENNWNRVAILFAD